MCSSPELQVEGIDVLPIVHRWRLRRRGDLLRGGRVWQAGLQRQSRVVGAERSLAGSDPLCRAPGEFDNLPGTGKPLNLSDAQDPDWWIKRYVAREGLGEEGEDPTAPPPAGGG